MKSVQTQYQTIIDSGASQYGTSNKLLLKNIQSISGVNITAAFDTTVQP